MNVIGKNPAPEQEPETREEKTKILIDAEREAQRIKEQTAGQWFSLQELKMCIRRPIPVCETLMKELSAFLLVEAKKEDGRNLIRYKINMDTAWRLSQVEEVKKVVMSQIQPQLDYFDDLKSIIIELHPIENSDELKK